MSDSVESRRVIVRGASTTVSGRRAGVCVAIDPVERSAPAESSVTRGSGGETLGGRESSVGARSGLPVGVAVCARAGAVVAARAATTIHPTLARNRFGEHAHGPAYPPSDPNGLISRACR